MQYLSLQLEIFKENKISELLIWKNKSNKISDLLTLNDK